MGMDAADVVEPTVRARREELGLYTLCMGVLMIVLDTTVVNVALPAIQTQLGFTNGSVAWVVNAYLLTFGGSLLLAGRLGDLYGKRKAFLAGIFLFTLASLGCGLAVTPEMLVAGRALQGLSGAVVSAVGLSSIIEMFSDAPSRARALGVYSFVCAIGGSLGLVLGGALTSAFGWASVFIINLPVGVVILVSGALSLPRAVGHAGNQRLDIWGAFTVTAALVLALYGVVKGNEVGWTAPLTSAVLGGAVLLLLALIVIESRVTAPLLPWSFLRRRSIAVSSIVRVLWSAGTFAWLYTSTMYMQVVLEARALEVGLAFLPANLTMAAFALSTSKFVITRFGTRRPVVVGLGLFAAGLMLLARAPEQGDLWTVVVPAMLVVGVGGGLAFNPLVFAAMADLGSNESGLASGLTNTASLLGGALGLAVAASLADSVAAETAASGVLRSAALCNGYRAGFLAGAACVGLAAGIAGLFLRESAHSTPDRGDPESRLA